MEEEFSVANTNVADEHLWALSFYKCLVYGLQLSDLIWGLKPSVQGQGKGHGVSTGAFQLDQGSIPAAFHPVQQLCMLGSEAGLAGSCTAAVCARADS